MVDRLCILFSLISVVYIVMRAFLLDRQRPWFGAPPAPVLPPRPAPARR